jgi:hypothetical protein
MTNLTTCTSLIRECQELSALYYPVNYGNNAIVNSVCSGAYVYCYLYVEAAFSGSGVRTPHFQ